MKKVSSKFPKCSFLKDLKIVPKQFFPSSFLDEFNEEENYKLFEEKIEKFGSLILTAFNISNNLLYLAAQCQNQPSFNIVYSNLEKTEQKISENFPEIPILQNFQHWKELLLKNFRENQIIDEKTAADLEFEIINWLKEINSILQINITIFHDTCPDYSKFKLINEELNRLSKNIVGLEQSYSTRIIQQIIIAKKQSGLTIYEEKFVPHANLNPFLIGGFLSAISSFGSELSNRESSMKKLTYDNFEIEIANGKLLRVALILLGKSNNYISEGLLKIIKEFENNFSEELKDWKGEILPFNKGSSLIRKIFPDLKNDSIPTKEMSTSLLFTPKSNKLST
ncbi:MAG: hypothetical protein HWN67_15575 [Candidatus Helarchaeota archaeon]|nr:hypothetical protein [Candidatus Helarchaeota archaeon]